MERKVCRRVVVCWERGRRYWVARARVHAHVRAIRHVSGPIQIEDCVEAGVEVRVNDVVEDRVDRIRVVAVSAGKLFNCAADTGGSGPRHSERLH